MDASFPEMNRYLGFGCLRLPMKDGAVDLPQFEEMVDLFLSEGFNYFDTAHGYINGLSELALRDALTSRYPRDRYLLTDKLTESYFKREEDIRPFFEQQLSWCGVDYFDFYLQTVNCFDSLQVAILGKPPERKKSPIQESKIGDSSEGSYPQRL